MEGLQGTNPAFLWPKVQAGQKCNKGCKVELGFFDADSPNCHCEELRIGMVFKDPIRQFLEV